MDRTQEIEIAVLLNRVEEKNLLIKVAIEALETLDRWQDYPTSKGIIRDALAKLKGYWGDDAKQGG